MNLTKFTQKSMQAVEQCEKLAYEYGNQEIEQEHLLYSLLTIEDSLILKLIEKMEINKEYFLNRVEQGLQKRVKVQGGQIYVGQDLNKVLVRRRICFCGASFSCHAEASGKRDQRDFSGIRDNEGTLFTGAFHSAREPARDFR